jgi:hypothetical protein
VKTAAPPPERSTAWARSSTTSMPSSVKTPRRTAAISGSARGAGGPPRSLACRGGRRAELVPSRRSHRRPRSSTPAVGGAPWPSSTSRTALKPNRGGRRCPAPPRWRRCRPERAVAVRRPPGSPRHGSGPGWGGSRSPRRSPPPRTSRGATGSRARPSAQRERRDRRRGGSPRKRVGQRLVPGTGSGQQRLGGHTADVHARPADHRLLHQHDARIGLRYRSVYLTEPLGRGLIPETFAGYASSVSAGRSDRSRSSAGTCVCSCPALSLGPRSSAGANGYTTQPRPGCGARGSAERSPYLLEHLPGSP